MIDCILSSHISVSKIIIVNHKVPINITFSPIPFWIDITALGYKSWHSSFSNITSQWSLEGLWCRWLRFTPEFFIVWPEAVWNSWVLEAIAECHLFLAIPFLTAEGAENHEGCCVSSKFIVVGSHCCLIPISSLCSNNINFEAIFWSEIC